MAFTRREFLITGCVAGFTAARAFAIPDNTTLHDLVLAGADESSAPVDRFVHTLCRQCPGGCGVRVRIHRGAAVGIAGNPLHPVNRGGLCPRALSALHSLYNPDRLRTPRLLAGPKGSGQYAPIEWNEAFERLTARLAEVRSGRGPHTLVVLTDGDRGLRSIAWSRVLQAFGSNNLIDLSAPEAHRAQPAVLALQGFQGGVGYDLERARYVLSFNSQWLDSHWSPAQASRAYGRLRGSENPVRPKFVSIEPRLSLTGAKADEWVPVRPGSEGALALGLCHVLLKEGLYDRKFVDELCAGFEDSAGTAGRPGFRRLVLREYEPARVAAITGVDETTIFRLAREFAAHRPALAIGCDGSGVSRQRTHDRMAIHALNALVGSIDVPGGVAHFGEVDLYTAPSPKLDAIAEQGLGHPRIDAVDTATHPLAEHAPEALAQHILAGIPHEVEVLVLAGANPVFTSPFPERWRDALAKVPFVVSLSPWLDESTRWADLILPEAHSLMAWDLDLSHQVTGQPVVSLARPVLDPRPEERGMVDLVMELGRRLGPPVSAALPFADSEEFIRAVCGQLAASGRGTPFGSDEEVAWIRMLESSGWRVPHESDAARFTDQVLKNGGWTDPIYRHRQWDRVLRSPARRFSFDSRVIADRGGPRVAAAHLACMPHYEDPFESGPQNTFPLQLYVYPLAPLDGNRDPNLPWLIDAAGSTMQERWRDWLEIHPRTAREYGIEPGGLVTVTSARGSLTTHAHLFEGIRPDVVALPWGLGREGGGRWCDGIGQNPAGVVRVVTDSLTAAPLWQMTRVSVQAVQS